MFANETEELLIVGDEELGESGDKRWSHWGLGSSFAWAQALGPGTPPLAVLPLHLLTAAVETFTGVEVEVILGQLRLKVQERLQRFNFLPGSLDKLVSVHHMDLVGWEDL